MRVLYLKRASRLSLNTTPLANHCSAFTAFGRGFSGEVALDICRCRKQIRAAAIDRTLARAPAVHAQNFRPGALSLLATRYGQHRHDLHGVAREDRKVRVLLEEFGGGLMRVRAD